MDDKERILIVDDDEGICRSLMLIFETKGYETETARTGKEAIEKAQGRFFNVALLDIRLPDMEGVELLAPLKEMHPDMALILVTGYASLETAVQALNEGASAYITKPLNLDEVLANVREALEKQRLIKEKRQAEESLRQRNYELALLHRASQMLASTLDLDQVLTSIVGEVYLLLNVISCSVWLIVPETYELVCRQAAGSQSEGVRGWRLAPGQGIAGGVSRSGESLVVPDTRLDKRHFKGVEQQTGLELRSILCVPLRLKEEVIGVLEVLDKEVDRFRPAHLRVAEALAASAAIAVQNARLYDSAQRELTERKRAEEALKEAQERLIRSEKLAAIGQLASGVGHELRNPLAAIKNAVVYVRRKIAKSELSATEPKVLEFLDIIDEEVNSSNKVITDLLNFARVAKPTVSLVNVASIIKDALNHVAMSENVRLTMDVDPGLPMVMVDAAQIRQVFINIILNALEAMPEGGRLEIRARSKAEFVTVEFADTGCGIPESVTDKIFDPLFTTKAKGIGLGLAMCKSIMERHGGDIGVKSKEGKGTTFTLSLPTRVV